MQQGFFSVQLANPAFFQENRLPAHADFVYYETVEEAMAKGAMSWRKSLNGQWRFHYSKNLDDAPKNFFETDYPVAGWDWITVPGHIQLQGYDAPQYCNHQYPWDGKEQVIPGQIPEQFNPVASYVQTFQKPQWEKVCIHFAGVESAVRLWLNGHYVGYSEDSFTPAEFDLTPYIQDGENKLAVQVVRFSSGSWLEDQDFWRMSGIFREVYLFTTPKAHLNDFFVKAGMDGVLQFTGEGQNIGHVELTLLDGEKTIYTGQKLQGNTKIESSFSIKNPVLWSAEQPYLYTLMIKVYDETGVISSVIPQDVGFRTFGLVDGLLKINGKRIVFCGVNRHEFSHLHGRAITKEEMEWDVQFLKQHNVNAVRTSHYPNHPYWYQLCNQYGLYVIDETNLETHGTWFAVGNGYTKEQLHILPDDGPEWVAAVLSRAEAMVARDKNHPSVVMWSCGNESYGGKTIYEMSKKFKELDNTRPVHYEGVFWDRRYNDTSDVESQMYSLVEDIEAYLQNNPEKPFMLCEYAHTMGNSAGNFWKYTDLARRYEKYQGGFTWDYIDQAILTKDVHGRPYLAYGGDFEDRPNDRDFCCNGIVTADRKPYAKAATIKYHYQPIVFELEKDGVTIQNDYLFSTLENIEVRLVLLQNGTPIFNTIVPTGTIAPCTAQKISFSKEVEINWQQPGEYTIECGAYTAMDTIWANKGHEVAYQQLTFAVAEQNKSLVQLPQKQITYVEGLMNFSALSDGIQMMVSRQMSGLSSLKFYGIEMLANIPVRPDFWRAPVQNDIGNKNPFLARQWKMASLYAQCTDIKGQKTPEGVTVSCVYDLGTMPATQCLVTYTLCEDGAITVCVDYTGDEALPPLPMFGLTFQLPSTFEQLRWYGNGPMETYWDRKGGARLGIYESTVSQTMEPYTFPQSTGNKTDVRWAELTNQKGKGIRISAVDQPLEITAIPYTAHQLESVSHPHELPVSNYTVVTVALHQMGVGGDNTWGAKTHEEFTLPANGSYSLKFKISSTC